MLIKKRNHPLILQKYQSLQARLPDHSREFHEITREIEKIERGYQGELTVDGHLRILESKFTVLQDVTLETDGQTFQMDNLVITPHTIYIIEVKNFTRTLTFDTNLNQFTTGDGTTYTGFRHPITQVKMQKLKLQQWLFEHDQPLIPIHHFVAISEPGTRIHVEGDPEQISNIVMHSEHIPFKIIEYENSFASSATNKFPHQKIGYTILRHCTDFDMDILTQHNIQPNQLLPGIRCQSCNRVGMVRHRRTWVCKTCGSLDKTAAHRSVQEYTMLIKPWLTNKECKNFLGLHSRHAVKRILHRSQVVEYSRKRKRWERKKIKFVL